MTRLGVAIDGARILYRGVWPTYFAAPLGAAAIAARIWRLSEDADRARAVARPDADAPVAPGASTARSPAAR